MEDTLQKPESKLTTKAAKKPTLSEKSVLDILHRFQGQLLTHRKASEIAKELIKIV